MAVTSKPDLCLYHANCADGFTAAWAVWKALGDACEYVAVNYHEAPPDVKGRNVVIVDFSYPADMMSHIVSEAASVAVYVLQPFYASGAIKGQFSLDYSGARLTWQAFHAVPTPMLVRYVEDRDMWVFKLAYSKEIGAAILSNEFTFAEWNALHEAMGWNAAPPVTMVETGKALLRAQARRIAGALKTVRGRWLSGYYVPVVNCSADHSEVGNALMGLEWYDAAHPAFAVTYLDTAEGRLVSLRSNAAGIDVSAIAQQYGGGGHRNAAGFKIKWTETSDFLEA